MPPPPKLNVQPASSLQAHALCWTWTRPWPHDECCWSCQPERRCYDRVPRAQRADTADLTCCRPSSRWKQHYQHRWRPRQPALAGQPLQIALQAVHQKRSNSARRTTSSGCALAWCRCVQVFPAVCMDLTNVAETVLCSQRAQPQLLMMLRSWKWTCQLWRCPMASTPPASEVTWNADPPADVHGGCDRHIHPVMCSCSNMLSRQSSLELGTPRGRATWGSTQ